MGYSNPDTGCRRHPNQKQIPGVCSFCLRERLSKLSTDVSSSYNSSSSPSAPLGFVLHQGTGNTNTHTNTTTNFHGQLKKSKSVAWPPPGTRRGGGKVNGAEEDDDDGKEQAGLWKKLIHSTSKKTKGVFMHSITLKQRSHSQDTNSFRIF